MPFIFAHKREVKRPTSYPSSLLPPPPFPRPPEKFILLDQYPINKMEAEISCALDSIVKLYELTIRYQYSVSKKLHRNKRIAVEDSGIKNSQKTFLRITHFRDKFTFSQKLHYI